MILFCWIIILLYLGCGDKAELFTAGNYYFVYNFLCFLKCRHNFVFFFFLKTHNKNHLTNSMEISMRINWFLNNWSSIFVEFSWRRFYTFLCKMRSRCKNLDFFMFMHDFFAFCSNKWIKITNYFSRAFINWIFFDYVLLTNIYFEFFIVSVYLLLLVSMHRIKVLYCFEIYLSLEN